MTLSAVDRNSQLTPLDRQLARLPVDPRMGRMLLEAAKLGSLQEVLIVASAMSIQDPRERPPERQQAADQAHAQWKDADSDFAGLVNLCAVSKSAPGPDRQPAAQLVPQELPQLPAPARVA